MPAGSKFAARAAASKVLDPTHQSIVPKVNNVGAPGTVASRLRAWNNLSEIRRLARPNEPDWNPDTTPPDALDLTKFIEVCVGTSAEGFTDGAMRPQMQGKTILQANVVRKAISGIEAYARANFENWSLSKRGWCTIEATIDALVKEGGLLTGTWHPRRALGIRIVIHMVTTVLTRALRFGVPNWDIWILKIMIVVIGCATGCRAGALVVSPGYEAHECLRYEDIAIILDPIAPSQGSITLAQVTSLQINFRYEKGSKRTPGNEFAQTMAPCFDTPVISPILWILIHALRHDRVMGGPTLQGVLDHAFARPERSVEWTHPKEPLVCKLRFDVGWKIDLGHSGHGTSPLHAVQSLARASGLGGRITYHQLRYGSAQDIAHLPAGDQTEPGFNLERVREFLNHSTKTLMCGGSRKYAGNSGVDSLAKRNRHGVVEHAEVAAFSETPARVSNSKKTPRRKPMGAILPLEPGTFAKNPGKHGLESLVASRSLITKKAKVSDLDQTAEESDPAMASERNSAEHDNEGDMSEPGWFKCALCHVVIVRSLAKRTEF